MSNPIETIAKTSETSEKSTNEGITLKTIEKKSVTIENPQQKANKKTQAYTDNTQNGKIQKRKNSKKFNHLNHPIKERINAQKPITTQRQTAQRTAKTDQLYTTSYQ